MKGRKEILSGPASGPGKWGDCLREMSTGATEGRKREDTCGNRKRTNGMAGKAERNEAAGERFKGILSKRLQMLANMVTPGNCLADVGCDHGYLSIALVGSGVCPKAIAMDVREGPLAAARLHIKEAGLEGCISARLSDGLAECGPEEADTVVCAGMGGRLMEQILRADMGKARAMRELILQPQSELPHFRAFLREAGFVVIDEDAVREGGKYYFAMKAVYGQGNTGREVGAEPAEGAPGKDMPVEPAEGMPGRDMSGETEAGGLRMGASDAGERSLDDLYGGILLGRNHPVLWQYLQQRERYVSELENSLAVSHTRKSVRRQQEVRRELEDLRNAMACYGKAEGSP